MVVLESKNEGLRVVDQRNACTRSMPIRTTIKIATPRGPIPINGCNRRATIRKEKEVKKAVWCCGLRGEVERVMFWVARRVGSNESHYQSRMRLLIFY